MAKLTPKGQEKRRRALREAALAFGALVDVAPIDLNDSTFKRVDQMLAKAAIRFVAGLMTGDDGKRVAKRCGPEWLAFVRKNPSLFAAAFGTLVKESR